MNSMKKMERQARLTWLANLALTVEHANKAGIPGREILTAVLNGLGVEADDSAEGNNKTIGQN